ncbi:unnamed protein product [Cercospora beticola]|nr:unnamed protein product [Cercospora beticola]
MASPSTVLIAAKEGAVYYLPRKARSSMFLNIHITRRARLQSLGWMNDQTGQQGRYMSQRPDHLDQQAFADAAEKPPISQHCATAKPMSSYWTHGMAIELTRHMSSANIDDDR